MIPDWLATFLNSDLFLVLAYAFVIVLVVVVKIRDRGKIRAIILRPTKRVKYRSIKPTGTTLKFSKDWQPEFEPDSIFEIERSWLFFWQSKKPHIVIVEGAKKALNFASIKSKSTLAHLWSSKEIKEFIKKEVLKARAQTKPMSNVMFIVLMLLVLILIFLNIYQAAKFGLF